VVVTAASGFDRFAADGVMVVHFAFVVFVAVGGLLAWRWPRLLLAHVPAVAWGLGGVTVGYDCPLTPLEKLFRRRAGQEPYEGGFVDRYIEDVVYPDEYTPHLRALAAALILLGWAVAIPRFVNRRPATRAG
jgi:hypothetical protein